jgi:hypothetical protein
MNRSPYRASALVAPVSLELLAGKQLLAWSLALFAVGYIVYALFPALSFTAAPWAIQALPLGGALVGTIAASRLFRALSGTGRAASALTATLFGSTVLLAASYYLCADTALVADITTLRALPLSLNVISLVAGVCAAWILQRSEAASVRWQRGLLLIGALVGVLHIATAMVSDEQRAGAQAFTLWSLVTAHVCLALSTASWLRFSTERASFEALAQSADGLRLRSASLKRLSLSSALMVASLIGSILLALQLEKTDSYRPVSMQIRGAGLLIAALCLVSSYRALSRLHRWSAHIQWMTVSFVCLLSALAGSLVTLAGWMTAHLLGFSVATRTQAFTQQGMTEVLVLAMLMALIKACASASPGLSRAYVRSVLVLSALLAGLVLGVHVQCPDYVMRTPLQFMWVYATLFAALLAVFSLAGVLWRAGNGLLPLALEQRSDAAVSPISAR